MPVQRRDPKFVETHGGSRVDGIYYPRAGTFGGCTAHNAMIFVYPHNADWDDIAKLTGDASWSSANDADVLRALENCRHRPFHRWLSKLGINLTRHGWNGWLPTEKTIPKAVIGRSAADARHHRQRSRAFREDGQPVDRLRWFLEGCSIRTTGGSCRTMPPASAIFR